MFQRSLFLAFLCDGGSDNIHRYQKFNRVFDSVFLRYLFRSGERHEFRPEADAVAHGTLKNEKGDQKDLTAGVSGTSAGIVTLSLQAHVQRNRTVALERVLNSWRLGVSVEQSKLHAGAVKYAFLSLAEC